VVLHKIAKPPSFAPRSLTDLLGVAQAQVDALKGAEAMKSASTNSSSANFDSDPRKSEK
jgi:hypothetical protein